MTDTPYAGDRALFDSMMVKVNAGVPYQKGLSIGLGKKDGSDAGAGINYLKMFSDDPYEEYFQLNKGMVGNSDPTKIYAFEEAIVQHSGYVPMVTMYQHHVRTIDDAGASSSNRDAYVIDGGGLSNGWERTISWIGNNGAVVVAGISAWLSGLERRLRFRVLNTVVAEMHEDGGMTIGNVPSKGSGTLNVAGGIFDNGVRK